MPEPIARAAIEHATALVGEGGVLELSFAGGEPLLEALLVQRLMGHARQQTARSGRRLALSLTTRGLTHSAAAYAIMLEPTLSLSVVHDGLPPIHDSHRRSPDGHGTSERVLASIHQLAQLGRTFVALMLVRPQSLGDLAEGIEFLFNMGVPRVQPVLDLWQPWSEQDAATLEGAVAAAAAVWAEFRPRHGVSWFDRPAASPQAPPAGRIAVAPSGHLYPCAAAVGDDADQNPWRLAGHALQRDDFAAAVEQAGRSGGGLCGHEWSAVRCGSPPDPGQLAAGEQLLRRLDDLCAQHAQRAAAEVAAGPTA